MSEPVKTLAIVLSGGAGKRVGGRDKGLILHRGQPMISAVLRSLRPQVDDVMICVHRNEEEYKKLGTTVVVDASIEFEGPVAGITAALTHLKSNCTPHNYQNFAVSPCDVPGLLPNHVARLSNVLAQSNADVAIAHDGERKQNLHCLFTADAVDSLLDFYHEGGRAMHRWFSLVTTVEVDFSDSPAAFKNLNCSAQIDN